MTPTVGIVGSAGAYGRWFTRFLRERMGLDVRGHDPADPDSDSEQTLLDACDVLVFSVPIRHSARLMRHWAALAGARSAGRLWLDLTSIKAEPVRAMLGSQAEVVGLHPMTAPPKSPTLKGRALVVCEARLEAWRPFVARLLAALEAECVHTDPDTHDRVMAAVQALVHATHLAQAATLRTLSATLGEPAALLPFRSASFDMDLAMMSRILAGNPSIYEDIQFGNAAVPEVLAVLEDHVARLRRCVAQGDGGRAAFRATFLDAPRAGFGETLLAEGNHRFERLGYLLADLVDRHSLSVHLPEDRPGSLRALLAVFEDAGINLASIHSSRTPAGEVHFRFGFTPPHDAERLARAVRRIGQDGIGRVLPD